MKWAISESTPHTRTHTHPTHTYTTYTHTERRLLYCKPRAGFHGSFPITITIDIESIEPNASAVHLRYSKLSQKLKLNKANII